MIGCLLFLSQAHTQGNLQLSCEGKDFCVWVILNVSLYDWREPLQSVLLLTAGRNLTLYDRMKFSINVSVKENLGSGEQKVTAKPADCGDVLSAVIIQLRSAQLTKSLISQTASWHEKPLFGWKIVQKYKAPLSDGRKRCQSLRTSCSGVDGQPLMNPPGSPQVPSFSYVEPRGRSWWKNPDK